MPKQQSAQTRNKNNRVRVSLRGLKRELKLIPHDIKREMRFLDLLFSEREQARTDAEREVLGEFIVNAKRMVEFHQNRLERYQKCYDQLKAKKSFDPSLLFPEELRSLEVSTSRKREPDLAAEALRTGTDG